MAFKATKYFVVVLALVIGGTRYMNNNRQRINLNNDVGVWDSKAKDGLRYTVITRSNETDGKYLLVHTYCTAKAQGFYPGKPGSPPMHIHTSQVEEFEAIGGVLVLNVNGTDVRVPPGTAMAVPPGMPHTFHNGGSEPVEFLVRLTPGIPDESFLENVAGLSQQFGGLNRVNPIQLFLLFAENGIELVDVPQPLWLAAKRVLVPLARIMGFKSSYPEYTTRAGKPLPVATEAAAEPVAAAPAEQQAAAPEAAQQAEAVSASGTEPAAADGDNAAEL